MKTIFKIIVAICFCLSFTVCCGGNLKGEKSHTFYLYSKSSNAKIITLSEEKSFDFIYFKNSLKGESVVFTDKNKATDLICDFNAEKIFSEKGEDFYCEYYYTNKIDDYIILKGKKINLHVCYQKQFITVGYPLVFGSY